MSRPSRARSSRPRAVVAIIAVVVAACALAHSNVARAARVGPGASSAVHDWRRESFQLGDDATIVRSNDRSIDPRAIDRISWKPHAEVYRGFLTEEECEHLIELAEPALRKSTVVDVDTGGSVGSEVRTSSGMFLMRGEDEVVESIERRIAAWTHVPESHGEGFQVLRYERGQEYRPHFDYFHDSVHTERDKGGQRVGTVLMYLTDVEKGGETTFPSAQEGERAPSDASACARGKVAVAPKAGDALYFRSLNHNLSLDVLSAHAGCPVELGVKYSATKWMHVYTIEDGSAGAAMPPGVCKDVNKNCEGWAKAGECENNPSFMIGRGRAKGNCMRSCGACPKGSRSY